MGSISSFNIPVYPGATRIDEEVFGGFLFEVAVELSSVLFELILPRASSKPSQYSPQ